VPGGGSRPAGLAHEIATIHEQYIEGVENDLKPGIQTAMPQGLEGRSPVRAQGDNNLTIDHNPLRPQLQSACELEAS
jgi:hypothetical protein